MIKKQNGFTLIELIMFIVVTGLLGSTILMTMNIGLLKNPSLHNQLPAKYIAASCMEWFIGQKLTNGFSSLVCGTTTTPSFCTSQTGYTIATSITCTTINSDSNYKTITVTVSGLGNASLTLLVAS